MRNRHGIIDAVTPYQSGDGPVLHLVDVEYTDTEGTQASGYSGSWKPGARRSPPGRCPIPSPARPPMLAREFDALVRSVRWGAFQPYVSPDHAKADDSGRVSQLAFHAAIQTEDYQLVPLLKAMAIPRIPLLIADVGSSAPSWNPASTALTSTRSPSNSPASRLWVETMDPTLPFTFLDHKLRCGNGLVGAWMDQFRHYPVLALHREGGDKNHTNFHHHFREKATTQIGDVWTEAV